MKVRNKHILTLPLLLVLMVILLCASTLDARTRTTRKNLRSTEVPVAVMESTDNLLPDSLLQVDPNAVTLKGFSKRASESKESFFITNNTGHRMSAVRLLLRYTTMQGEMLTQRTVNVPVRPSWSASSRLMSSACSTIMRGHSLASRQRLSKWLSA